jgi:hypothetical protein
LNSDFKVAPVLWNPNRTLALTLNLNAASEVDLMTIPGVDLSTAREDRRQPPRQGLLREPR